MICRHFLFGFPHNWEEYILHGFGEEHNNGNTGFGDSSTCPLNSSGDALPFITDYNISMTEIQDLFTGKRDLNCCLLKKFFNDTAVGIPLKNVSEQQSDLADNIECNITTNTKDCKSKEDTNLETSALQDDQMLDIEAGVTDVTLETHKTRSFGRSTHRREARSISRVSVGKKMSEDADNFNFRRVTRSVSKMSHTSEKAMPLRESKKIRTSVTSPVRRSPRLCNLKIQAHNNR